MVRPLRRQAPEPGALPSTAASLPPTAASLSAAAAAAAAAAVARPVSRRAMLAGGAAVSVFVALPDVLAAGPARAATNPATTSAAAPGAASAASSPSSFFFLYGSTGSGTTPGFEGWRPPAGGAAGSASALRVVGSGLAARPVRSADGALVAFPTVGTAPTGATVALSVVASATGAVQTAATLVLPGVPQDASVLVRPVFAGTATLALVIAVSVPTGWHTFQKPHPNGSAVTTTSATWTTHHLLAYLDLGSGAFTGPFDLGDAPALAWTDAAADAEHLYLWTLREPAVSVGTKAAPLPAPPVRLLTFPLGSGRPVQSARSAGSWPSGATALVLPTGDVARVADGRDLEVYSPQTGASTRLTFAELQLQSAKAGATTVHPRPDGTLVVANAAFGRAIVLDPASAYRVVTVLDYPRPRIALGGPDAKTALSPDGTVLYTLGPAAVGGLSAYEIATGDLVASVSDGTAYSGVYQLPSSTLLAVKGAATGSTLGFFSPSLTRLGASSTDMYVAEVF